MPSEQEWVIAEGVDGKGYLHDIFDKTRDLTFYFYVGKPEHFHSYWSYLLVDACRFSDESEARVVKDDLHLRRWKDRSSEIPVTHFVVLASVFEPNGELYVG